MSESEHAAKIALLDRRLDTVEKALWWLACIGPCGLVLLIVVAVSILERAA